MASSAVHPPGGTWFDSVKRSFVDVPIDENNNNAISTSEFLEASESLATLFDVLGSVAFTPVKSDMHGNIKVSPPGVSPYNHCGIESKLQKIRDRQLAAPAESENLQSLVINELKTKKHTAAEGLLWLVRGLDFTAQGLRENIKSPTEELSTSFRTAYASTLKPYHSFLVKPVFTAAMSATPYRNDFYKKLADDQERGQQELRVWLAALEKQVAILKQFQARKEAKW